MSKYDPLWNDIKEKNQTEYCLTFKEIEQILKFPLDHSFLTYKKELNKYGYKVIKIMMKEKKIIIAKLDKE